MPVESRNVTLVLNEAEWRHVEERAQRNGVEVDDMLGVIVSSEISLRNHLRGLQIEDAGAMSNGRPDGYPVEEGSERFAQLPAEPAAA